mmetsp:Transcript_65025/g.203771  ORF Transcript_65025/g.203771 Transcript_65025/m.203771 type:complete len:504 (-) Transcript_65025:60-1571(-)
MEMLAAAGMPGFGLPSVGLAAELGLAGAAANGAGDIMSGLVGDFTQPAFALDMATQSALEAERTIVTTPSAFTTPAIQSGPTKLFVGSVPAGVTQEQLHEEFAKFGPVSEIFLKHDAGGEAGRMWGFVTYVSPESAAAAVAGMNEQFIFPGATRPLAVSFARSSVSSGTGIPDAGNAILASAAANPSIPPQAALVAGPTKLFVGSIPGGTSREAIRAEFERFGSVMDVFLKNDRDEPSRMWGFVTYGDSNAAASAVDALNERLVLPGGSRPCSVRFARSSQAQHSMAAQVIENPGQGQTKLFIGTIPAGTTEAVLRREFERFGQVAEVFLKNDAANEGRMWGFLTYVEAQSAAVAVSSLHEKLMLPGSVRPCAVSFARQSGPPRNQTAGLGGMDALAGAGLAAAQTEWKVYYTAQGLAYYHNATTGVTQWECPPELGGSESGLTGLDPSLGGVSAFFPGTDAAANTSQELVASQQTDALGATSAAGGTEDRSSSGQSLRYSPY